MSIVRISSRVLASTRPEMPRNLEPTRREMVSHGLDDRRDAALAGESNSRARRAFMQLAVAVALLVTAATIWAPPDAGAAQRQDWKITSSVPSGSPVMPGTQHYRLYNRTIGRK